MPPIFSTRSDYQVWVCDTQGTRLYPINEFKALGYALVVNDVGEMSVTLNSPLSSSEIGPDYRLEIERAVNNQSAQVEGNTQWFVYRIQNDWMSDGTRSQTILARNANCILDRRIVAYRSDSAYANITNDNADSIMKQIVRTNYGSLATDTARQTALSIDGDTGEGALTSMQMARQRVLDSLKQLADYSAQQGTPLFFGMTWTGFTFQFSTRKTSWGNDRRQGVGLSFVISVDSDAVGEASLVEDYDGERNFVYAGGEGDDTVRTVQTAEDTNRSGRGPYSRIEDWVDVQSTDDAIILAGARSAVNALKPRKTLSATLRSTVGSLYGVDWNWGDFITVTAGDDSFNCRIDAVQVQVDGPNETITAQIRSE